MKKSQIIADEIVKNNKYKGASYAGRLYGKDLYSINRGLTGHIGMPIYVLISDNGGWEYIEGTINIFKAMDVHQAYLDKSNTE